MRRSIFGVLLAALAASAEDSAAAKRWWSHVEYLASDRLAGREPGTEGYAAAAKYVAQQFDSAKLVAAGTKGYFQVVPFERLELVEPESSVEVVRDASVERLVLGRDAILLARGESGRLVEAGAVFVGHGLRIPELNIDDLAGLDLKGKIAVILRGAPKHVPGPLAASAQSMAEQWGNLRAAGAVGVISVANPKRSDIPWERAATMRGRARLELRDPDLVDTTGQQVALSLNADALDQLLAGTGRTGAQLLALMDQGKELPRFPLSVNIRAKTVFRSTRVSGENVLALLPGSDPKLRNEYIVFSAHLDHVGTGAAIRGDSIYNGAMDNASGVATLIEVARALSGRKLKRSVLFAAVTGEESGLLGSKYLAAHPSAKAERVVANLNTDMFLPIIPLKAITVLGLNESDLGPEFAKAAASFGVEVKADPEPHRNGFIRSDQYSFIRRGVPALALKFYAEPGTPDTEALKTWLRERYHAPSDDLNQPVDREAAAQFNRVVTAFLDRMANRDAPPEWNADSFFRRFVESSN